MKRTMLCLVLVFTVFPFPLWFVVFGGLEWLQINLIKMQFKLFYDVKLEDIKWTSDFRAKFIGVKVKISDNKTITIDEFENLKAYLP